MGRNPCASGSQSGILWLLRVGVGYLEAEMFLSGVCLHLTYDDSQYLLLYEIYQDEEMPLMLSKETIAQQCRSGQQSDRNEG